MITKQERIDLVKRKLDLRERHLNERVYEMECRERSLIVHED